MTGTTFRAAANKQHVVQNTTAVLVPFNFQGFRCLIAKKPSARNAESNCSSAESWWIEKEEQVIKVKVKVSLEQATKAQRGSRCIALLFLQHRR